MHTTRTFDSIVEMERYALQLSRAVATFTSNMSLIERADATREALPFRRKIAQQWKSLLDAEQILTRKEIDDLSVLDQQPICTVAPRVDRVVIVLKATRLCNLRCIYCNAWAEGAGQVMPFSILAKVVRELLLAPGVKQVDFVWHGGEVMLLKPKFFRKMIYLQEKYRSKNQSVTNSLQTNATRISEEWLSLLAALNLGVGVSIDGPPALQNRRRPTVRGEGSAALVEEGLKRLREAGIQHAALVVIDREMLAQPIEEMLAYFASVGLHDVDFLNYVPSNENVISGERDADFVSYAEFCQWMRNVYSIWLSGFRNSLRIRFLDDLISALRSASRPDNCYFSGDCLDRIFTVEAAGNLAPCDKFIGLPGSDYGSAPDMLAGPSARFAAENARHVRNEEMSSCRWNKLCHGGCPHDRLAALRLDSTPLAGCCGMADLLDDIWNEECGALPALGAQRS